MAKALVLGGANGLLGKALVTALTAKGWETSTLGRQQGDVRDFNFLRDSLENAAPDVVFNAIAWTDVDGAEDHPEEALELNRSLPDALARIMTNMKNSHLVHFSTDFVFGGKHTLPWKENEDPLPTSVYGSTKLEGERAITSVLPDRSCILRTAWLYGPGRKDFVDTIIDLCQKRDMINVVDDQIGSPTYSVDLAQWSVELAEKRATGIWHTVNSGQASWCELASEAIHLVSGSCRVAPISSDQWPQKAKRPPFSVLDNSRVADFLGKKPRPWPQALRDYLFSNLFSEQRKLQS